MTAPVPEMVERVARVLSATQGGDHWFDQMTESGRNAYRDLARQAIAALREPTEAMMRAGGALVGARATLAVGSIDEWPGLYRIHQAVIDAALQEPEA